MKFNKIIIPFLLTGAFFLTSCVSTQKYNSAIAEKERLEADNTMLYKRINNLEGNKEIAQIEVNEALIRDWKEAERTVDTLQEMYMELRTVLMERQMALDTLYNDLTQQLAVFYPNELYLSEEDGRLKIEFYDQIFFESGMDTINQRGREALRDFANIIRNQDHLNINVVGHTDNVPVNNEIYDDNWDLSVARSASVVRFLEDENVDPNRLTASGKSKYEPLAPNALPVTKQFNRRTEIVLIPEFENDIYEFLISQN